MSLYTTSPGFDLIRYIDTDIQIPLKLELRLYNRGDYIYLPHQNNQYVYELVNGAIKVGSYSKNGSEVPFDILSPGDIFGNLNFLGDNYFYEYTRAHTSCSVRLFSLPVFKDLITSDKNIAEWYHITQQEGGAGSKRVCSKYALKSPMSDLNI